MEKQNAHAKRILFCDSMVPSMNRLGLWISIIAHELDRSNRKMLQYPNVLTN